MSWIVKDTSKLASYGFTLEKHYDDDGEYLGSSWNCIALNKAYLRTVWLEIPEEDVMDDESIKEAEHRVYVEDTFEYVDDEKWQYALPLLSKLLQGGVIEWQP